MQTGFVSLFDVPPPVKTMADVKIVQVGGQGVTGCVRDWVCACACESEQLCKAV